jgi:hypothetical protein
MKNNNKTDFNEHLKELKESKEIKERENSSGNSKNEQKEKEIKDYQKPIIKKESNQPNKKKNYHFNNDKEVNVFKEKEKEKEKEIDTNVSNLKRNLSNNKESNKAINQVVPSFAFNYDKELINKQQKIRSSIEIETNRTPKVEKIMPDSKSSIASNDRREKQINYDRKMSNNVNKKVNQVNNVVTTKKQEKSEQSTLNTNENCSERKRSGSRGSTQEEREKHLQLKDFMRNMKENVKLINFR